MNDNIINSDMNSTCENFQEQVSKVLIRHKSILDMMTKLDEYNARINRAVAKSVTSCGCISINATKQDYSKETFEEMLDSTKTHVEGNICDGCKEVLNEEIGSYLFYLAALCNSLDLNMDEILKKEYNTIKTLGVFSLK
ncbi:DUF1573 domain-containing protein [Tissierella praeacuta]|uniref:DUF1573 domain-containing protein n=1 Tax=Tissierella praeacuta DSM 18095 TaxID=1123404 RepID=A0A1M4XZS9_9FIRM|nr:DUF1573 domain-containing protein [Tissierella praeacuta]MBU5256379.1 DUF1573 domain-containing protein [Tissierella praeacuta]TCU69740.1 hypothetical protein EV204_108101 [Tissierella praeacuta]SHE99001.1 hypothetical protein SAMN02745784_02455 [Tissierella praeacuta DSM 18095]SUP03362.1 Uncharacterised protein [Tissierella praeacuta]